VNVRLAVPAVLIEVGETVIVPVPSGFDTATVGLVPIAVSVPAGAADFVVNVCVVATLGGVAVA
jgi:hypothetical protein